VFYLKIKKNQYLVLKKIYTYIINMSKKITLGKKIGFVIVLLLLVWLVWKIYSSVLSKKKEGYFAPLGEKKESFAPLGKV